MISLSQESDDREGTGFRHETVLGGEVCAALAEAPAGWVVDCTLGGGGHAEAILLACPHLNVVGLDRDPAALQAGRARLASFGERFQAIHTRFSALAEIEAVQKRLPLAAVVADLGASSHQFDRADRGFSFRFEGPLDMRMDPTQGPTLGTLLEETSVEDLADVLYEYGDIRRSIGTARLVLQAFHEGNRTTKDLADRLARRLGRDRSMHPATQVFQALRIWVNRELHELETLLASAPGLLAPGGRMAVISFHSGEDRLVKHAFVEWARRVGFQRVTRKALVPGTEELAANPRSRSARLRVLGRRLEAAGDMLEDFDNGMESEVIDDG